MRVALFALVLTGLWAGCEAVAGGLVELHWELSSPSRGIVGCSDASVSQMRLQLTPVGGSTGGAQSFSFDCTVERAETGFVVSPGDYLAVLSAVGRAGVVGCSGPIYVNIDFGKPSSLHVVEVQLGALGCPSS